MKSLDNIISNVSDMHMGQYAQLISRIGGNGEVFLRSSVQIVNLDIQNGLFFKM